MAGVQRTRIGYGNEGRTKQLAASLSDFIRLFSLYHPTSPPLKTTQHTKSLVVALLAGGVGGGGGGGGWVGGGGGERGVGGRQALSLSLSLAPLLPAPPTLFSLQAHRLESCSGSSAATFHRVSLIFITSLRPRSPPAEPPHPTQTSESSPSPFIIIIIIFFELTKSVSQRLVLCLSVTLCARRAPFLALFTVSQMFVKVSKFPPRCSFGSFGRSSMTGS